MPVRSYDNTLRREQAEGTRGRILEAVRDLLVESPSLFSIPAIAARAGVSEPTIYRHFANRGALLDALASGRRYRRKQLVDDATRARGHQWRQKAGRPATEQS